MSGPTATHEMCLATPTIDFGHVWKWQDKERHHRCVCGKWLGSNGKTTTEQPAPIDHENLGRERAALDGLREACESALEFITNIDGSLDPRAIEIVRHSVASTLRSALAEAGRSAHA